MQLNSDPAQLASAASDLLLTVLALFGALRTRRRDWRAAFVLMAAASALGALIHGLERADPDRSWWWWPLDLALAAALVCFGAAAARDRWGTERTRPAWWALGALACVAAGVSRAMPATFLPMLTFQAAVVLCAGVSWSALATSGARPGAGRLAAGCAVALLAGGVGASGVRIAGPIPLDANTLFHLIQAPALLLWASGARAMPGTAAARA